LRPDPLRHRPVLRVVRFAVFLLVLGIAIQPVLEYFGHPLKDGLTFDVLTHWLLNNGLRVVLIAGLAAIVLRFANLSVDRLEEYLAGASGTPSIEHAKRAHTLGQLIRSISRIFIVGAAGLMALNEVGVNTAPLLAGAGIAGLAIGFGGQTLVKDVISGFFIILDDQVRVGDTAEINGTTGLVEAMTLRTIVLRDARGAVYVFPCGSVTKLANLTKDFAYAVVDVQVDAKHDVDEVVGMLKGAADAIRAEAGYAEAIFPPAESPSFEQLTDTTAVIRVRLKCAPQRLGEVGGDLRRRVKKVLAERGIEGPVTQTVRVRT
jgi:small conductance mechanosensitive channel